MEPRTLPYSPTTTELDNAGKQLALDLIRRYHDPLVARCVIILSEIHVNRAMSQSG